MKSNNKISQDNYVIVLEPGKSPRCDRVPTAIEDVQELVGGYVQMVQLATDFAVLCNENGKLEDMPFCCEICGHAFVGTILLCGLSPTKDGGHEIVGLPLPVKNIKNIIPQLWN